MKEKFSIKIIIKINRLLEDLFENVNNTSKIVDIVKEFNQKLKESENKEIKEFLNELMDLDEFKIEVFSEDDNEALIGLINQLEWKTAYSLFKDVFSKDSKYMTVHQAKGLEWKRVFVSINPTRGDATTFSDMFKESNISSESTSDEFTRMFYVACSRAIEELYICIDDSDKLIIQQKLDEYIKEKNINKFYDFL